MGKSIQISKGYIFRYLGSFVTCSDGNKITASLRRMQKPKSHNKIKLDIFKYHTT